MATCMVGIFCRKNSFELVCKIIDPLSVITLDNGLEIK